MPEWRWRYHGNYVGPGWSAGKYQDSVAHSNVPAIDEFDKTAKDHDAAYALKKNLKNADYKFFYRNIGRGFKRSAAALAVGAQGLLRPNVSFPKKYSNSGMAGRSRSRPRTPPRGRSPKRRRVSTFTPRSISRRRRAVGRSRSSARYSNVRRSMPIGAPPSAIVTRPSYRVARGSRSAVLAPSRLMKLGVFETREDGDTLGSAVDCQWIGHASIVTDRAIIVIFRALIKALFNTMGQTIPNFEEDCYANSGDSLILRYRTAPDAASASVLYAFGASQTYFTVARDLAATFVAAAGSQSTNVVFETLEFSSTTRINQIHLRNADIEFYFKSDLKVQNRSVTVAADNEADDVNNVPLFGRTYSGSGTGLLINAGNVSPVASTMLLADKGTGLITLTNSSWAREPVQPWNMVKPGKAGKVHFDPGEIKTSTIVSRGKMNLSKFYNMIWKSLNTTYPQTYFGKYQVMALEKVLDPAVNQAAKLAMTISYELQQRFGAYITPKKNNHTIDIVSDRV